MKRVVVLVMAIVAVLAGMAMAEGVVTLREGKYVIGSYTITCIETEGERMKDAYGALGDAMDALDDSEGYGSMFGAFGSLFDNYVDMSVEILGDFGDVLRSYSMRTGDTMAITLEEGTALQISAGSCTLAAK